MNPLIRRIQEPLFAVFACSAIFGVVVTALAGVAFAAEPQALTAKVWQPELSLLPVSLRVGQIKAISARRFGSVSVKDSSVVQVWQDVLSGKPVIKGTRPGHTQMCLEPHGIATPVCLDVLVTQRRGAGLRPPMLERHSWGSKLFHGWDKEGRGPR